MGKIGSVFGFLVALALLWRGGSLAARSLLAQTADTADLIVAVKTILMQENCELDAAGQAVSFQQAFQVGQAIASDGLGRGRLVFSGGQTVTVYRDTCLVAVSLAPSGIRLRLHRGTLLVETPGAAGIMVETPGSYIAPNGTAFVHYDDSEKLSWTIVKLGGARMTSSSVEVALTAGQQTWAEFNQPPVAAAPARREVVGLRFLSLDDLTNGSITEADFLPWPNYAWIAGLVILAAIVAVVIAGLSSRRRRSSQPQAGLRLVSPAGYGRLVPVRRGVLSMGRALDNALRLTDHTVSRRHARIVLHHGEYYLQDLNSAGGTFIGEERITRRQLHHGDRIRVGRVELEFQVINAASAVKSHHEPAERLAVREAGAIVPAALPIVPRPAQLRLLQPPGGRGPVHLTGADFTIGRRDDNDLVLDDPKTSSQHARVSWEDDSFVLEDLGSTNGTYVEGQRITRCSLRGGEKLRMGDSVLVFEFVQREEVSS
jgi:pSer/pThr/pTyr-binding forkhead associated (FHA) protein